MTEDAADVTERSIAPERDPFASSICAVALSEHDRIMGHDHCRDCRHGGDS